jgi:hypothetical protein
MKVKSELTLTIIFMLSLVYLGISCNSYASSTGTPNSPILGGGMTAVKWSGTAWVAADSSNASNDWYDYNTANKKWANAQLSDGSLYVWIPRYTYKITYTNLSDRSQGGTIDIKYSSGTTDDTSGGYIAHPAFYWGGWNNPAAPAVPTKIAGGAEITGIWIAKFEASNNGGKVQVLAGKSTWRNITVNNLFNACLAIKTDQSLAGVDSHLIKNSEWGAVAYLAKAVGTVPSRNSNSSYISGGNSNISTVFGSNTTLSTTGTPYGIYDMNGGTLEHVASYVNNGHSNLTNYGSSLVSADAKYKDVFPMGASDSQSNNYAASANIVGMAVNETSANGNSSCTGWDSDASYMPRTNYPFFERGEYYSGTLANGIFSFDWDSGQGAGSSYGFRSALINEFSITTGSVSSITATSATVGNNTISGGGITVTERGIVYSTSANPTISGSKVQSGSGTGSYSANLTGLTLNTTYHVRAYAITSSSVTYYGNDVTFTTLALTDTTPPTSPTINFVSPIGYTSGNWANEDVSFTLKDGTDTDSGVNKSEYSLSGAATTAGWTIPSSITVGKALDYTVFSGSQATGITISKDYTVIKGNVHTNNNFSAQASGMVIDGICEASGTITNAGTLNVFVSKSSNASIVDMPDYSQSIEQQSKSAGNYYTGDKTFTSINTGSNSSIYVDGNVTINNANFIGTGCIFATGNITINGTNTSQSSSDALCFYSKNGDITINGMNNIFDGILYAPKGSIILNSSNLYINGRVIGNTVAFNGSSIVITSGANEINSLVSFGAATITNEGQTTITARTIDNAGNASAAASAIVKIDKTAPAIDTLPLPGSISSGANVKITATDTLSNIEKIYYKWDSSTEQMSNTGVINVLAPVGGGSHTLTITAHDNAGNIKTQTYTYNLLIQPQIMKFTDMVTGVNKRYANDPAKAALYNKYTPGSEIVEKIILDPNGGSVNKYTVQLDLAGGSTAVNNIIIKYIKIARIADIGNEKVNIVNKTNGKDVGKNYVVYNSSNPYGSKSTSFDINVPPANRGNKIVVYLKYYFKKLTKAALSSKTYQDKVTMTADGGTSVTEPLTINVRDVKIKMQ